MREIKFRAWDNIDKVMLTKPEEWQKTWRDDDCDPDNDYDFKLREFFISHEGHLLKHTYDHGICDTHYYLQGKPRFELLQYTGLKDKNGKEIYEGDIVKRSKIYEVFWDMGSWFVRNKTEMRCFLLSKYNLDWEVIGNIYENPELLEVEK